MDRVPILKWLPKYKLRYLFYDLMAGFTVALTAIPQGMAYAIVAGLPPQYGLYSCVVGGFVYLFLGSCKDVTTGKMDTHTHTSTLPHHSYHYSLCASGPTAILALLISRYVAENLDFAIFLAFVNGIMITMFGLLNLGFLVQFISQPVCNHLEVENELAIGIIAFLNRL